MTTPTPAHGNYIKTVSDFVSQGTRCSGWLYRPEGITKPPVIIMGSFLGGEKTFKLPDYAERFAQQGFAVFLFDYRTFGASEGKPRNLIDPWHHLQDWRAALDHVRRLSNIDTDRVALWGSSFAGGHVIMVAAEDSRIKTIVCQVPAVDGLASAMMKDWRYLFIAVVAGLRDLLSTLLRGKPYCIPIVAPPDRFGILNTPESEPGYTALVDKTSAWENKAPARFCLKFPFYRPLSVAHRVHCPALVLLAEKDSLIPAKAVEKAAAKMGKASLISLPCDHFTPYFGDQFEQHVKRMISFLAEHLRS